RTYHVDVSAPTLRFHFRGKSGKERSIASATRLWSVGNATCTRRSSRRGTAAAPAAALALLAWKPSSLAEALARSARGATKTPRARARRSVTLTLLLLLFFAARFLRRLFALLDVLPEDLHQAVSEHLARRVAPRSEDGDAREARGDDARNER